MVIIQMILYAKITNAMMVTLDEVQEFSEYDESQTIIKRESQKKSKIRTA